MDLCLPRPLLFNWAYRYRDGRVSCHVVILLLLLLLLLVENVWLRLENQSIWGLVLPLMVLMPKLILIPIVPSHVILIVHHLVLELLLLLVLHVLLLHVPLLLLLLLLLSKWVVINILESTKSNRIVVLIYPKVFEQVM